MSRPGNKKTTLVAPRRAIASGPSKSRKSAEQSACSRRKSSPRRKPSRNIFVSLFRWLFGLVFGVIWWIGIRVTVLVVLVLAGSTMYYYSKLPPAIEQVDGRSRG